jgi:hypothetical protein
MNGSRNGNNRPQRRRPPVERSNPAMRHRQNGVLAVEVLRDRLEGLRHRLRSIDAGELGPRRSKIIRSMIASALLISSRAIFKCAA